MLVPVWGAALALVVMAKPVAANAAGSGAKATLAQQASSQELLRRCQRVVAQGLCRVMAGETAATTTATASRVFVAGTGEVDAALSRLLERDALPQREDCVHPAGFRPSSRLCH